MLKFFIYLSFSFAALWLRRRTPLGFSSFFTSENKKEHIPTDMLFLFLAMGYKKDIFGIIEYEFELLHKSRRKPCISSIPQGIAYHQNEVLYIIIAKRNAACG